MLGANGSGLQEAAARLLAEAQPWDSEQDDVLVCRAVRQETHDVRTFVLAPRDPRRFAYKPGQFLTFTFEIGGETIHRCYTISAASWASWPMRWRTSIIRQFIVTFIGTWQTGTE